MSRRQGFFRAGIVATGVVAGLLASGSMVLHGTEAVFTANTTNGSNTWGAGTVTITDNDSGSAMFTSASLGMLVPSAQQTRCITVTYGGTALSPATNAAVKLYISASTGIGAGNLGDYLDVTIIDGGTGSSAAADCTGFPGSGTTNIVTGTTLTTLAQTNTAYASGLGTWAPTATNQTKAYKFVVQMKSTTPTGQQGNTASATFTWEANAGT